MGTLSETLNNAKIGEAAKTKALLDQQGLRDQARSNIQQQRAFSAGGNERQAEMEQQAQMQQMQQIAALNSMREQEMMQQEANAAPGLGMGSNTMGEMQQLDNMRADEALTNEAYATIQKVQQAREQGASEDEIQMFKQQVNPQVQQRIQQVLQKEAQQEQIQQDVEDVNNTGSGITELANQIAQEAIMPQQQEQQQVQR